jgi:hypothetical protein
MEHNGRIITGQVKSREGALESARKSGYYKRIDYFIAPNGRIGNGIVIYNREGKSFRMDDSGRIV